MAATSILFAAALALGFVIGFFTCFAVALAVIGKIWTPEPSSGLVPVRAAPAANDDPALFDKADDALRADLGNFAFVDPTRYAQVAADATLPPQKAPKSTEKGRVFRRQPCNLCLKIRRALLPKF